MSPFRGTDEVLDREIETLEGIAQRRVKRYAREMRDLDRDLSELKRERAKRRATSMIPQATATEVPLENET
jgi:hypothetical protein